MMRSHSLVFSDFETRWYKRWSKELKQNVPDTGKFMKRSNKFWQNAMIAQVLFENKRLKQGVTGIGFGVGKERLPALFANYGVKVCASDQDFRTKKAKHWSENELATNLKDLNELYICDPKKLQENVELMAIDMTKIPPKLNGAYDFVWSNCALGHLGSIEAGLQFIINSSKCLKPGGIAVHTTELNVLSNDQTVVNGDTVIFRPKDVYGLAKRLRKLGFIMEPFRLTLGNEPSDQRVQMFPVFGTDHSKIQVGGHLATQIILIIRRPKRRAPKPNKLTLWREERVYKQNLEAQQRFNTENPFMKPLRSQEAMPLPDSAIVPLQKKLSVTLRGKPKGVYVSFQNKTDFPLFSVRARLLTTMPIALATAEPTDRKSIFANEDWHNGQANRPSVEFYQKQGDQWKLIDFVPPHASFAMKLVLDPKKAKKGVYSEHFGIVQEGNKHLRKSIVEAVVIT